MNPNESEIINSENDTETTENTEVTETDVEVNLDEETHEEPAEDVEELKKKLATTEAQKEHWRQKAQKGTPKAPATTEAPTGISYKDITALTNAGVHEDDVEEVVEYAKFKKISIADALKSNVIKTSLAEKKEFRSTAEATNTAKARGQTSKVSEQTLLAKAQKTGEIPESAEDLDRMLEARYTR